jgi:VIT1/CCC1 family predicted Fe2+/Mn2+ transporter
VARQLTEHGALSAHARDELGLTEALAARPIQAALASAATFAMGAALPLVTVTLVPEARTGIAVAATSLVFLAALGALSARAGGAGVVHGAVRVTFWSALAMILTDLVGRLFGRIM